MLVPPEKGPDTYDSNKDTSRQVSTRQANPFHGRPVLSALGAEHVEDWQDDVQSSPPKDPCTTPSNFIRHHGTIVNSFLRKSTRQATQDVDAHVNRNNACTQMQQTDESMKNFPEQDRPV